MGPVCVPRGQDRVLGIPRILVGFRAESFVLVGKRSERGSSRADDDGCRRKPQESQAWSLSKNCCWGRNIRAVPQSCLQSPGAKRAQEGGLHPGTGTAGKRSGSPRQCPGTVTAPAAVHGCGMGRDGCHVLFTARVTRRLCSPPQDTLNNNSLGKKHSWQERVSRSSSPLKTGESGGWWPGASHPWVAPGSRSPACSMG